MRISVNLNENNEKDKVIIEFLEKKYSSVGFIKETMYTLAIGEDITPGVNIIKPKDLKHKEITKEVVLDEEVEEFEEIEDLDQIEL